jgi:cysteinyl-tRNA synthetase
LRLFNTLTRRLEEVVPAIGNRVRIYSCGPTVYRFVHLGNLRTYLMSDWLRRALEYQGCEVYHIKNITDVGHQRQELLERGEDKVIAAAIAEGRTPQEIAESYTQAFIEDEAALNILPAHQLPRASDHIADMVAMTEKLVSSGHAYAREGNVYFAVSRFDDYGRLSGNLSGELLQEAVRGAADPLKEDPRDFALWKAAEPGRELKWSSPWGDGFPGWHIECSAMSTRLLGERFEIHTGGVDNIFPHHEDERAQSEAALGHRVVDIWLHGQHLLVDGVKMAKSTGNVYDRRDLERRGYEPLAFRYLCATVRPRSRLNFTFEALRGAQRALDKLRGRIDHAAYHADSRIPEAAGPLRQRFVAALNDNLNLPAALAITWEAARSPDVSQSERASLLIDFDRVLGLGLHQAAHDLEDLTARASPAIDARTDARHRRDFGEADRIRAQLAEDNIALLDRPERTVTQLRHVPHDRGLISASDEVPSNVDAPDSCAFSLCLIARDNARDLRRCLDSFARFAPESTEAVVIDSGASEECRQELTELERRRAFGLRVIHADHDLGTGAAHNATLRCALGRVVMLLDTSIEAVGDVFTPIGRALEEEGVGAVGPFGVRSADLREFHEARGEVDAIEGYLIAFRRSLLPHIGLMDERFRFYRHLDLDYSLRFRAQGLSLRTLDLPLQRHAHMEWEQTPPEERDRLSKRNFYRFLKHWGDRHDLLVG